MTARPFGDLVTEQIRSRPRTAGRVAYRRAYARALYALRDHHEAEFHELLEHLLVEAQAEERAQGGENRVDNPARRAHPVTPCT